MPTFSYTKDVVKKETRHDHFSAPFAKLRLTLSCNFFYESKKKKLLLVNNK